MKEKLKGLLKDLFQFENKDLDFGIYRIMNYKKEEIKRFIDNDLIIAVKEQLNLLGEEEKQKLVAKLEGLKKKDAVIKYLDAIEKGEEEKAKIFEELEDVKECGRIEEDLGKINISEDLEREIYNHLINFFSRYYDKGDFISKRRYGRNEKYVVPYNGEEVLLYWANRDQYYIKTTEYFRKYSFKVEGLAVNFRVVEAEEEKGNVKAEEKKFFVLNEKPYEQGKNELDIYFEYRALANEEKEKFGERTRQDDINKHIIGALKEKLNNGNTIILFTEENGRTILEKHLNKYTKRNTTDYFIHKDLKGFLERELDFYIKNDVLDFEDMQRLDNEKLRKYLLEAKVIRNIALKITEFLSQIENYQKRLWEKKKFVVRTDYVVTLDKIKEYAGEEFLESILDRVLSNDKQLKEWKELFGIEVKSESDLVANNTLEGKELKKLPIDTKYFDDEFKWKLIIALSKANDLDAILGGVLIKSENWQTLSLLLKKYLEKVQTIYIDPPFNTTSSVFLYKNDFKHSSWISMMENRLQLAKDLLRADGIIAVAIDDAEVYNLTRLLNQIFCEDNYIGTVVIESNPRGRTINRFFATCHEYCLFYAKDCEKARIYNLDLTLEQKALFNLKDEISEYRLLPFRRSGGLSTPDVRPNSYYPIYYDDNTGKIDIKKFNHSVEILPIDTKGAKRVWRQTKPSFMEAVKRGDMIIKKTNGGFTVLMKDRIKEGRKQKTIWVGPQYDASSHGTVLLEKIFGESKLFTYPKSYFNVLDVLNTLVKNDADAIILDFLAGSGTTAHAVMKLNKEDDGKRKFILVEMAEYFDTVMIPRIKKVAYSFNWKDGKPQDTDGFGVFFKYHCLEQYEDALENIEFKEPQKALLGFGDYFVKYIFDFETKDSKTFLNIDEMQDPFNYKLKVIENYETKVVNIDLIETFNYLLGIFIKKIKKLEDKDRKYVFVFGEVANRRVTIIWRSIKDMDFEEDKKIIEENIIEFTPDEIYVNGDCAVRNFGQIENEFKALMFERVG